MENDPKRKEVYEWRTCIESDCEKKRFYISVAEKEYFEAKATETGRAFVLPKRCYPCRVKRRNNNGSHHGKTD